MKFDKIRSTREIYIRKSRATFSMRYVSKSVHKVHKIFFQTKFKLTVTVMKVAALVFVVCCLTLCFAKTFNLEEWGDTSGKLLGNMAVYVPSEPNIHQARTFAFTVVSTYFFYLFSLKIKNINSISLFFYRMKINQIS